MLVRKLKVILNLDVEYKRGAALVDKLVISGGKKLKGRVIISGAKNAAVAILPAAALSDGVCRIENIPNISDINIMCHILRDMGADVRAINRNTVEIDPRNMNSTSGPYDLMKNMRASSYLLGVLLGKFGEANVCMPGGCNFGVRPIDQHLKGFAALGAECEIDAGVVHVKAEKLVGAHIYLDVVSVGATMNIMLAAVKAEGQTVIENAAKEPHIVDLANFLNCMGAEIVGAGTDVIKIHGVKTLKGATYSIIPDQIEAGTYMAIAAATGGDVVIDNIIPKHLESITAKLEEMGIDLGIEDDSIRVSCNQKMKKCNIKTMPHPGFPTDMQPQITALLSFAEGTSMVTEAVWDNRFRYVDELGRMGANIKVDGRVAVVEGVEKLTGATVHATDLRAGAALVLAGLAAEGVTVIEEIQHIERGYENIIEKLTGIGADIKKVSVAESESDFSAG